MMLTSEGVSLCFGWCLARISELMGTVAFVFGCIAWLLIRSLCHLDRVWCGIEGTHSLDAGFAYREWRTERKERLSGLHWYDVQEYTEM